MMPLALLAQLLERTNWAPDPFLQPGNESVEAVHQLVEADALIGSHQLELVLVTFGLDKA
jgi:hypothetical protein